MQGEYTDYIIERANFPANLAGLADMPSRLYCRGAQINDLLQQKSVTIIGSRQHTLYGKTQTRRFSRELAEQSVVIISGLAFGIDSIAHQACLDAGGKTIAVVPGGLDCITPRSHLHLAERILQHGGAIISRQPYGVEPKKYHYLDRNKVMAGLADAILITESKETGGTRASADYAVSQNRTPMVVPGDITSFASTGTNRLLKLQEAHCVTAVEDILSHLGLIMRTTKVKDVKGDNPIEQVILDLLACEIMGGDTLLQKSGLDTSQLNQTLTMLEIKAKIQRLGSNRWGLC